MKEYNVYILENTNGDIEYVGMSTDVKARFNYHRSKNGAFTKRNDISWKIIKTFTNSKEAYYFEGELKLKYGFEWTEKIRNSNNATLNYIKQKGIPCPQRGLKGERNNKAKLTYDNVLTIKELLKENKLLQKDIAERFNVTRQTIRRISQNKTWS